MTPTSAKRGGARYRYHVSCALFQGRKSEAGSASRVPAPEIETQVLQALRQIPRLRGCAQAPADTTAVSDRALVGDWLDKIIVRKGTIELVLNGQDESQPDPIVVVWTSPSGTRRREITGPNGSSIEADRPIRSETRARLVEGIAKARLWLDELVAGRVMSTGEIAKREGWSERFLRCWRRVIRALIAQ